ncbi:MAG TPA: hypothetical protein VF432_28725 [Thermoanaerobaculia bacterium]
MNKTILAAVLLLCALTAGAQQVRYRSADTVYLTIGSAEGVAVGDRYEIVRNDKVIATVEVIFVAERSASAKVINESTPIAAGDAARRVGGATRPAPRPPATPATTITPALSLRSPFSLSGTATFDAGDDRSLGRLSLRARHIADLPLHARIRARASSEEDGNRLYEASLSYEGRILGARVGRIGNTPYVGLGYLDGALVSVNVASFLQVGAFGGLQPNIRDLSFDAGATKYGAFARVFGDTADLVVAAATVEDNPFVAVDGRWAVTQRVSLFAHGRAGDESFNTMAGVIGQLTPRQSVTVSYERVDPGPDDDLRTTDQVINDFLRQGARVSYRGPYATLGAGLRSGDEGDDPTYSATAGLSHPSLFGGVYAGIHATGFSSELSDGLFAQLRAGRRFGAGHSVELSAGALMVDETALDELSSTAYLRGALWIELPYDLFARGEAEFTSGDSRSGHRFSLGAGYRF